MTTLIKLPEVKAKTSLSTSTIYRLIKSGKFPKPIHMGPRAVAWVEEEIDAWIEERIKASRDTHKGS